MPVYYRDNIHQYGRYGTTRFTIFAWPLLLLAAACIGFLVGGVLQLVPAIGQILAVGPAEAWTRYHTIWLRFAVTGSGVMVVVLLLAAIVDRFYVWRHAPNRPPYWDTISLLSMPLLLLTGVCVIGYGAFHNARNNVLPGSEPLLPASVRSWLMSAIADVDADRAKLRATEAEATMLSRQLAENRERLVRLRDLLEQAEPITKRDLAAVQDNGRMEGIVLGILTSIVASYIFSWLPRPRKNE